MNAEGTTLSLFKTLADHQIQLSVHGSELRVHAPQGKLTDALRQQIREQKAALIAALTLNQAQAGGAVIMATGTDSAPLSAYQRGVWLTTQLSQVEAASYNMPLSVSFHGPFQIDALHQALNWLADRHQLLRCCVREFNEEVMLTVSPAPLCLQVLDLTDTADPLAAAHSLVGEDAQKAFDLSGLLWRSMIIRLSSDHVVFACNFHHLIMDGQSVEVFKRELLLAYTAFSQGQTPALSPLPVQYLDYCLWQHQQVGAAEAKRQLTYWQQQLRDLPEPLPFHPLAGSSASEAVAASVKLVLEPALAQAINQCCRQQQITAAVFFYSVFNLLLARLFDRSDVLLGTPVSHRDNPQLAGLLGFFVNTLVLRRPIDEQQSFASLLAQSKETYLQAFEHKDTAFEHLVSQLAIERQPEQHPVFQVLYSFYREQQATAPVGQLQSAGLTVSAFGQRQLAPKFPLALYVVERAGELRLELVYDRKRVAEPWAAQLLQQLHYAIPYLLQHIDRPLLTQPLLQQSQIDLVTAWGQTAANLDTGEGYLTHFAGLAARYPQRVAVSCDTTTFTFAELAQRSDQLAATIQAHGVLPGAVVALYSRKCSHSVLAMLACWKAGVAYLPLDVRHPPGRVQQILDTAAVSLVIGEPTAWHVLQRAETLLDLFDDNHWQPPAAKPQSVVLSPETLAYVIFTSGSTGTPKGVAVSHGAILNQGRAVQQQILRAGQRYDEPVNIAVNASLVFDVSVTQIVQLYFGATLRLITDEQKHDLTQLWQLWQRFPIAVFDCTPSYFQLILDTMDTSLLPALPRCFLVAGEGISEAMWLRLQQLAHTTGCRVINAYGPTECTVYASFCDLADCTSQPQIGGPLVANQLYVLDKHRRLMPPGCTGELYVGGAGLASGYYRAPELTQERFVEVTLADNRQHRLYKTGDLVCWDFAGQLIYKGRSDNQIKLRGFRVELDDIVHAISHIPGIRQAAVRLFEQHGDQQLVAYYLSEQGETLAPERLAGALQEKLPFYMLPNQWIWLETMPMTINGKLDVRALPLPGAVEQRYEAPADELELMLADIWQTLLGQASISVTQNLWQLGVHSLLFMWASMKLQNQLKIKVPVKALFERSTVRAQAALCRETLQAGDASGTVISRRGELQAPMSYRQLSLWLAETLSPADTGDFNMSYSVRIQGPLHADILQQSFSRLIKRHETLRTKVIMHGAQPQLSVQPDDAMNWQFWDFRHHQQPAAAIEQIVQNEHLRSFDLQYELPLRLHLFQLADDDFVLCMTMHHLCSDGWSMQVIRKDLVRIYAALAEAREPELPELSVQYNDYAFWLNQQYQSGELLAQKDYWRAQLADFGQPFYPPRPDPAQQLPATTVVKTLTLGPVLSGQLRQLAAQNNTTLYATLLASYQLMLAKITGLTDVLVVTPFAEREAPELEPLVGFFVNTLILRNKIDMSIDFNQFIQQVRDCCVGAFSHAQIGYHEVIAMAREMTGNATLFDDNIMFAFKRIEAGQTKTAPMFEHWQVSPYFDYIRRNVGRMTCSWLDNGTELTCSMMFRQDLVAAEFQQQLAEYYPALLNALVAAPLATLQDIGGIPAMANPQPDVQPPTLPTQPALLKAPAADTLHEVVADTEPQLELIRGLWARLLQLPAQDIALDTEFFRYGGHSLLLMELLVALRQQFGVEGDAAGLLQANTIRKQAAYLRTLAAGAPQQAAFRVHPAGTAQQQAMVFFAPALGASASSYQRLVSRLTATMRVGLLTTPGIDEVAMADAACHRWSLNARLRHYLQQLLAQQPKGPYTLIGHSFGADIIFELAVLLELRGHQVQVVLLDSLLGALDPTEIPLTAVQFVASRLPQAIRQSVLQAPSEHLPSQMLIALQQEALVPDGLSLAAFEGYLQAVDAQLQIYYSFHPSNRLAGTVTLLEASQGLANHPRRAQIRRYIQQYATKDIHILQVPGSHIGLVEQPDVVQIIQQLVFGNVAGTQVNAHAGEELMS